MGVSYEKDQRQRAIQDRKGLFTIEVIGVGSKPGHLGSKMRMQGPADAEELKIVTDFMLARMKARTGVRSK